MRGGWLFNIGCGAAISALGVLVMTALPARGQDDSAAAYPKPSLTAVSWELKFTHSDPKRIVITLPGERTPSAFWYISYSVVNPTDATADANSDREKERIFYPVFVMRNSDGKLINGNDAVHPSVFDAIKQEVRNKYLEEPTLFGGRLLLGADQQRDSVAIWPESPQRMGAFKIFVSGLWGETAAARDSNGQALKDAKGDVIELHKTLMLTYHVDGDEKHFAVIRKVGEEYVMR